MRVIFLIIIVKQLKNTLTKFVKEQRWVECILQIVSALVETAIKLTAKKLQFVRKHSYHASTILSANASDQDIKILKIQIL